MQMETAIVKFTNPDSEGTEITLTFNYDREAETLEYKSDFKKESDEKLDFIGFLASSLLLTLTSKKPE
mgnify:CR=1 FL=1